MKTETLQRVRTCMGILGMVLIFGVFGILGPTWAAADAPVTVMVDGQWANAVGAKGGSPTCLAYRTSGGEQQVRYGDDTWPSDEVCPNDPEVQSGLGFSGAGEISFQIGVPFKLGDFRHYNRSIWADNPLESVDLAIALGLGDSSVTLYYTLALNETDNVQCLPGEASPCEDVADIVTTIPNQTFVIGDMEYTLQILGFGDPNDLDSITGTITTDENDITHTALVGQFVVVGPDTMRIAPSPPIPDAPALCLIGLGLAALGGVLWYGRRTAFLPKV